MLALDEEPRKVRRSFRRHTTPEQCTLGRTRGERFRFRDQSLRGF
jgi:hypothetical protein